MFKPLTYQSTGQGTSLVFIHGWGLNSAVWQPLKERLSSQYKIITIDLPGFGTNVNYSTNDYSIENICQLITSTIKQPAIYIGWSLGGLIASYITLHYSQQVKGLITITSSPYFMEIKKNNQIIWHGIKSKILQHFYQQLDNNIEKTLINFLKIQAMGSPTIRQDIKQLQSLILQSPTPHQQALANSLALLETIDLRSNLQQISVPFLRLYGRLDTLVPKASIPLINQIAPQSDYYIFTKASHAPFISHLDEFQHQLERWLIQYFP